MAVSKRPSRTSARPDCLDGGMRVQQPREGILQGELADIQRARIVKATCYVAAERGANRVTVGDIVERAGVSRRTFYNLFSDRDECFVAAFEQALSFASARVVPAYEEQHIWRDQIRAALIALLGFLDEEPVIGRVLFVESAVTDSAAQYRRRETIDRLTRIVEDGARETKVAKDLPAPLTGEGVIGGVLSVIHSRLSEPGPGGFLELAGPLMSMIVLPYLGSAVARVELKRELPKPTAQHAGVELLTNPFRNTGLRLTYRTVRVLIAIAGLAARNVNASNRVIAETAEIKDQGQVSKLLMRLQRAGLVANTGLMPGKGGANNWTLTNQGQQVVSAIGPHTQDTARGDPKR